MKKIGLLLLTIHFVTGFLGAQDRIQLLSGREKVGYFDSADEDNIYYRKTKERKRKKVDKENVFRVIKSTNDTLYVYVQDTLAENDYSIGQMEQHILGQREARKYFKPYRNMLAGFCLGGIGSTLSLFYAFIPPGIYTAVMGVRTVNTGRFEVSDESLLNSDEFVEGYELTAKGKKVRYAAIGGIAGIAVGLVVLHLYYPSVNPE